jgi:hypothetical protein
MAWFSSTLARLINAAGPLFPLGMAAALAAGALLTIAVLRTRRAVRQSGRWLEIIPPAQVPSDGAALWRTLVGIANQYRRGLLRPGRLAVEIWAAEGELRAGVWVPGRMPARPIADAVTHAIPRCRVLSGTTPPKLVRRRAVVRELCPIGGPWTPLIDPAPRLARSITSNTEDPLRSVYGALSAAARSGGRAGVQLVISPYRRRGRGSGRPSLLVRALRVVLDVAQELLTSGSGSAPRVRPAAVPVDPVTAARARDAVTKQALSPHVCVTVRVIAAGPGRADVVRAVVAGYPLALTTGELRAVRARRWRSRLADRVPGRGCYVTVAELAALWHLPPQPADYGMRDAQSRTRPAPGTLPRHTTRRGWSDTGWPDTTTPINGETDDDDDWEADDDAA